MCFGNRIVASIEKENRIWKIRGYFIASKTKLTSYGFERDENGVVDGIVGRETIRELIMQSMEDLIRIQLYSEFDGGLQTVRHVVFRGHSTAPCRPVQELTEFIVLCGGQVVNESESEDHDIFIGLDEESTADGTLHISWFLSKLMAISQTSTASYKPPGAQEVWNMFDSFKHHVAQERDSPRLLILSIPQEKPKRPIVMRAESSTVVSANKRKVNQDQKQAAPQKLKLSVPAIKPTKKRNVPDETLTDPPTKKTKESDTLQNSSKSRRFSLSLVSMGDSLFVMSPNLNFLEMYKCRLKENDIFKLGNCSYYAFPALPAALPAGFVEVLPSNTTYPSKSNVKSLFEKAEEKSLRNRLKTLVDSQLLPTQVGMCFAQVPKRSSCQPLSNTAIGAIVTHCGGEDFGRGLDCSGLAVSFKGTWKPTKATAITTEQLLSRMMSPYHFSSEVDIKTSSLWACELWKKIQVEQKRVEDLLDAGVVDGSCFESATSSVSSATMPEDTKDQEENSEVECEVEFLR